MRGSRDFFILERFQGRHMVELTRKMRFLAITCAVFTLSFLSMTAQTSKAQPTPPKPRAAPEVTSVELRPVKDAIRRALSDRPELLRRHHYQRGGHGRVHVGQLRGPLLAHPQNQFHRGRHEKRERELKAGQARPESGRVDADQGLVAESHALDQGDGKLSLPKVRFK